MKGSKLAGASCFCASNNGGQQELLAMKHSKANRRIANESDQSSVQASVINFGK